jgi:hypothetical protein
MSVPMQLGAPKQSLWPEKQCRDHENPAESGRPRHRDKGLEEGIRDSHQKGSEHRARNAAHSAQDDDGEANDERPVTHGRVDG